MTQLLKELFFQRQQYADGVYSNWCMRYIIVTVKLCHSIGTSIKNITFIHYFYT